MADIIKGSNGRSYAQGADGKLNEIFVAAEHAKRLLEAITESHTVTGVRVVNGAAPDEPAIVLTFEPAEAAHITAAIKAVLQQRAAKS